MVCSVLGISKAIKTALKVALYDCLDGIPVPSNDPLMKADFSMKQTNVFNSCLARQVNEAVRIEMSTADCVMNSKAEFHQAPLVRLVPVTGLLEDQEAGVDPRQPAGKGRGGAGRRARGRAGAGRGDWTPGR